MTIVCIVNAKAHVPARLPMSHETNVILSILIYPFAKAAMNLYITNRKQSKAEYDPYSDNFTITLRFFMDTRSSKGKKRMSVRYWVLNLLNMKPSLGAMASPKKKNMMEQSWSTIRSMQIIHSKIRQKPVINLNRFYHFPPRIRLIVHSTSLSSSDMWTTYILQVRQEIMPEMMSTIELVTIPVDLNKMGMVSIAPPTIELNIARTVVVDVFTLSLLSSLISL